MRLCQNYAEWKHCITEKCGIPLTTDYVEKRITALNDMSDPATKKFVKLYGEAHLKKTLGWFEQARGEAR